MSSLMNLQIFGAAAAKYDFPPPPMSEQRVAPSDPSFGVTGTAEEPVDQTPTLADLVPPIATSADPNESAGALLQRVADVVAAWRSQLPSDVQPGLLAILQDGSRLEVERLSQEGFHGIRIEGSFEWGKIRKIGGMEFGRAACLVMAHQATVQLLCFAKNPGSPLKLIEFVIDGKAFAV